MPVDVDRQLRAHRRFPVDRGFVGSQRREVQYEDDYRVQVLDLIAKKAAGEEFELQAAGGEPPRIVDMMEALEASVAAAKAARKRHPTARPATEAKKAAAKRPARRKSA